MRKIVAFALLVAVFVALAGCNSSSTRFAAVWKDPQYAGGPFKKLAVFAVIKDQALRRTAEDSFIAKLPPGTQGVAGYGIAPGDIAGDMTKILPALKENGVDGVIVSRLAGKDERRTFVPGQTYFAPAPYAFYNGLGPYYGYSYGVITSPGYTETEQVYRVETNIYNVADEKLVWSGLSESVNINADKRLVDAVIGIAIKELKKQKLIADPS